MCLRDIRSGRLFRGYAWSLDSAHQRVPNEQTPRDRAKAVTEPISHTSWGAAN